MLLIGSVGSGFSLILTVLHWPVMQHRDVDQRHQRVALAKGLSRLNHSSARHRTPSFHMEVMFFMLGLSHGRKNINFLRIRQQLLSTWPETNKAAVTSGFTCCFTVTAGASTSPLQSLAGFTVHRRQRQQLRRLQILRDIYELALTPPETLSPPRLEVLHSGRISSQEKSRLFWPKVHTLPPFFWGGFDPKSVRKTSEQHGKI